MTIERKRAALRPNTMKREDIDREIEAMPICDPPFAPAAFEKRFILKPN